MKMERDITDLLIPAISFSAARQTYQTYLGSESVTWIPAETPAC